jgi:hypothetical protein
MMGQRCVTWWNRGALTFDLGPVMLDPDIPIPLFISSMNAAFDLILQG